MSNAIAQHDTLSSSPRVSRDRVLDRVSIVAGFADGQRRDVVVSPLTYAGTGYAASAAYDRIRDKSTVAIVATWDAQRFRPQSGVSASTENVLQGELRAAALRTLNGDRAWTFSAGAAASVRVVGTEHWYPAPYDSRAGFVAGFATVGPSAQVRRSIGDGTAQLELDAPVFGFSDRTYSETKSNQTPLDIRRVGPGELRTLNGAVSYAPAPLGRVGLIFAYRFSLLNYRDAQPLRSASQSFSIGLSRYFGGGAAR